MSRFFALFAIILSLGAYADEGVPAGAPHPSPSPAVSEEFLRLPAYDFERTASAQNNANNAPIKVGDTFDLQLSGLSQSSPVLSLTLPPGGSLEDQGLAIEKVVGSGTALTATVVAVRSGEITIPSLLIVGADAKGANAHPVARTNPFSIKINSAIQANDPKPQEAAPAQPPVMIDFPKWMIVLASVIGVLILVAFLYWIYRWNKARTPAVEPEYTGPPLSEDEAALAALLQLEKSDLGAAHIKKHAFRVSEILKVYIGKRYEFDAPECTTVELLGELEKLTHGFASAFDAGQLGLLKAIFEALDLVKFADHIPAAEEASQFVSNARKFVLSTRKRKIIA
jgi:hypothetical protein